MTIEMMVDSPQTLMILNSSKNLLRGNSQVVWVLGVKRDQRMHIKLQFQSQSKQIVRNSQLQRIKATMNSLDSRQSWSGRNLRNKS